MDMFRSSLAIATASTMAGVVGANTVNANTDLKAAGVALATGVLLGVGDYLARRRERKHEDRVFRFHAEREFRRRTTRRVKTKPNKGEKPK